MPKHVRLCAIVQLCLTCSWMLLLFLAPFTGEHFAIRSDLLLFEHVTGIGEGRFIPKETLQASQERFAKLSKAQQHVILEGYRYLENAAQMPASSRVKRALWLLTHQEAPFLQAWFVAGMVLPILLLLRREGSVRALWILPLITGLYACSHFLYSVQDTPSADAALFPTEEQLRVYEDPAVTYTSSFERMKDAWQRYLVRYFSPSTPLLETAFSIAEAEYQFTLARVLAKITHPTHMSHTFPKRSNLFLALFLGWHLLFACLVERAQRAALKQQQLSYA